MNEKMKMISVVRIIYTLNYFLFIYTTRSIFNNFMLFAEEYKRNVELGRGRKSKMYGEVTLAHVRLISSLK